MQYLYNFSAGPAMLPFSVREKLQQGLINWQGTGLSVMEMSHRGKEFQGIAQAVHEKLRAVLNIPEHYKVLIFHGGATAQFEMIPMNLLSKDQSADYVCTGFWSEKAYKMAQRFGNISQATTLPKGDTYRIPALNTWQCNPNAAYLHYTDNETIHGIEFSAPPKIEKVPLVADMSSNILSRPINVEDYGLIYACSQKNAGITGATLVIVREDLIQPLPERYPQLYSYEKQLAGNSILNTPATLSWYALELVLDWLIDAGGLATIATQNTQKAEKLYAYIDSSELYSNNVHPTFRSRMNVPFHLKDENLNKPFAEFARSRGLIYLEGHRAIGGMRASIYNAMPMAGVKALIETMQAFEGTL